MVSSHSRPRVSPWHFCGRDRIICRERALATMEVEYEHDGDADVMQLEDSNVDDMPVTQEDAWAVIR